MNQKNKLDPPVVVFYSYSHKDEPLREELVKHLTMLRRSGLIREWHDRKILPGEEWDKEISENLENANLILLLISSDFISSDYCYDIEALRALERHNNGQATLIPIILRPVNWSLAPFSKIQALPLNAQPVTQWSDQDLAFVDICEGILTLVNSQQTKLEESVDNKISTEVPPKRMKSEVVSSQKVLDAALPEQVVIGKTK